MIPQENLREFVDKVIEKYGLLLLENITGAIPSSSGGKNKLFVNSQSPHAGPIYEEASRIKGILKMLRDVDIILSDKQVQQLSHFLFTLFLLPDEEQERERKLLQCLIDVYDWLQSNVIYNGLHELHQTYVKRGR